MSAQRGFTVTEVMLASMISVAVILVFIAMEQGRIRMQIDLRGRTRQVGDEVEPAVAILQLVRHLELADRVRIVSLTSPAVIQLRRPLVPDGLDDPASYRWVEYAHVDRDGDGTEDALRMYDNTAGGCANSRILTPGISAMSVAYKDTADAPPGGDPDPARFAAVPADTNVVEYSVTWDGPLIGGGVVLSPGSRTYHGAVTNRAEAYSDLEAGATGPLDSGRGLAPAGVSDPPTPSCCNPPAPCI